MSNVPITQLLQEGGDLPATSDGLLPADIKVNGRDLPIAEHYRILQMSRGEVAKQYVVADVDAFIARVRAAIRFWDGVEL